MKHLDSSISIMKVILLSSVRDPERTDAPPRVFSRQLFGCGSVAQVTTSGNTKGEYLSINLGFALGTTFGVYVSKGVSGRRTHCVEE